MNRLLALIALLALPAVAQAQPDGMVLVRGGTYQPLYESATGPDDVAVDAFFLAETAVTNAEYLAFVRANPAWRRSAVKPIFADGGYLRHWTGDLDLGAALPEQPVVNVSWFAARAYAAWKGMRLPTTDEWEYAASASAVRPDGRSDPDYTRRLLLWYGRPTPNPMPAVGSTPPNYWGVRDLHGLVWEWVGDFTSALITADSRSNRDANSRRFCAAGAVGASDFEDYAAFLRFGFRGGLEAHYTVPNLGFRLAADAPQF
jgi:formylglycine-generating enzyme required for sulfatase activity